MTRTDALLRLIAIEPVPQAYLVHLTGWPVPDTQATLRELRSQGLVTHSNHSGCQWLHPTPQGMALLPGWPTTQGAPA